METTELEGIMSWIKGTDLVEVCYKEKGKGFSFAAEGAVCGPFAPAPAGGGAAYFSGPKQSLVASPAIGIFQWGDPGKPRTLQEGAAVSAGDRLGRVEAGQGHHAEVSAPRAGRLSRVLVEAGKGVEYGQPLFIIEENV